MCEFKPIARNGPRHCENCQHWAKTRCNLENNKTDLVHEPAPPMFGKKGVAGVFK